MAKCHRIEVSALLAVALLIQGCGMAKGTGGYDEAAGNDASVGGGSSGEGGQAGGGSDATFGGGEGTPSSGPDAGCAMTTTKGELKPLDIYIMLDQSKSMDDALKDDAGVTTTRWVAVTSALKTFVSQPNVSGISVGIQYFDHVMPKCTSDSECGSDHGQCSGGTCLADCWPSHYSAPEVEISPLPGAASAITSSINAHYPIGQTPTSAALQGAIDHATVWAKAHPNDITIVVFATDGDPHGCNEDDNAIAAIAHAAVTGTPQILTYVIGVASSKSKIQILSGLAAAGGTTSPFFVDTASNTSVQFLNALNAIRGSALGCTYQLPVPKAGKPDYGKINVQYTPPGGVPVIVPQVSDASKCQTVPNGTNAWYYDNPTTPASIVLCKATCDAITTVGGGEVDIVLGCQTQVVK